MRNAAFALAILGLFATSVGASVAIPPLDDEFPPPWRGEYSTTSQVWHFLTPEVIRVLPDGPVPENLTEGLPEGMPPLESTRLWVCACEEYIDVDTATDRMGIWPLSGWMDVVVDNHEPPNEFKWVWLQVTWRPQITGAEPIIENLDPEADADYPVTQVDTVAQDGGWFTSAYEWRIYPNPEQEWFTLRGDIEVDQLIVDTWCIPEPATLALMGLGGLVMLFRRRRR